MDEEDTNSTHLLSDEAITNVDETSGIIQQYNNPTSAIDDDNNMYVDYPTRDGAIQEAAAKDTCVAMDVVPARERNVEGNLDSDILRLPF